MTPRRGDRAAPPPVGTEYDLRFASAEAADGWEQLARQAAGNLRRAFDRIRAAPRATDQPTRHHRDTRTAWITYAGTGHPKGTD
jgi:hypothetical protein